MLIISTLLGCPVGCAICDAGGFYHGRLTEEELWAQLDYLVQSRYPDGRVPAGKFKIQFARMGEPAFNPAVLTILRELPQRYTTPGLLPSFSTVAPDGVNGFFEDLLEIKRSLYPGNRFQLQFSLHSTDEVYRDRLIPVKKWSFTEIAAYGERFHHPNDRKITLNFVPTVESQVEPHRLLDIFDPDIFLIKLTPLNPTYRSRENNLNSSIDPHAAATAEPLMDAFQSAGYEVLLSIGEPEENLIGSNCGQYVQTHLQQPEQLAGGYKYAYKAR